jgi:hypothetical protein
MLRSACTSSRPHCIVPETGEGTGLWSCFLHDRTGAGTSNNFRHKGTSEWEWRKILWGGAKGSIWRRRSESNRSMGGFLARNRTWKTWFTRGDLEASNCQTSGCQIPDRFMSSAKRGSLRRLAKFGSTFTVQNSRSWKRRPSSR